MSEGALHVMPTLTALEYGEDFLYSGCIDLNTEVGEAASQFLFHCLPLQDPEHPCNIWYDKDHLCSDCSGEDIAKPIQLARLHSNVSPGIKFMYI